MAVASLPAGLDALAVVLARGGELPAGAEEAVAEAGGAVLVAGDGAEQAAAAAGRAVAVRVLVLRDRVRAAAGRLAARLAPAAGRGAADRAAGLGGRARPGAPAGRAARPAAAGRRRAASLVAGGPGVAAQLCRLDDRIVLPVQVPGPAVVTLAPGTGVIGPPLPGPAVVAPLGLPAGPGDQSGDADQPGAADPDVLAVIPPTRRRWTWPRRRMCSAAARAWRPGWTRGPPGPCSSC